MKYDAKRYALALTQLCQDKRETEIKVLIDAWLNLIITQNQKNLLPQIIKELEIIFKSSEIDVEIQSAKKIDEATKVWLHEYLTKTLNNKKVTIKETINAELLAGYLIKYQDKELNLSLKGILTDLREQIIA